MSILDTAPVVLPTSFAARIDLLTAWGDSPERPQIARLCAAAVALSLTLDEAPPKYDLSVGDILTYGAECIDFLCNKGIPPVLIYRRGSDLINAIALSIPTEVEVDTAAVGFQEGVDSTK